MYLNDEIVGASGRGGHAFNWLTEVDANTFDDPYDCGGYESLCAKTGAALIKKLHGYLLNKVRGVKNSMMAYRKLMKRRPMLHIVFQHFKVYRAVGHVSQFPI